MNKILITGGAGYIGSHTLKELITSSYEAIVLDNLSTGFQAALPDGTEFIHGDVRDENLVVQILKEHKIQAVIHMSAKLNVKESVEKPAEYLENNVGGLKSVLKAMMKTHVKNIVFSSTAAVYSHGIQDRLIREHDEKKPITPYGESKLECEKLLKNHDVQSCILRFFNVAGGAVDGTNGQRTSDAFHLIHLAAKAALGILPELKLYGTDYPTSDGTCVRDYIHVQDLAEIHVLALENLLRQKTSSEYNCGYGVGYSVREVISMIKKISGIDFKVAETDRRPGDAASLIADPSKLKKELHWKPQFQSLELICKTAYEWEKKINGL